MGGAFCICGWAVMAPFVQCCRVYVHEPVLVRVDLISSCHRDSCHPHSACPSVFLGKKSYVDSFGKTSYYDDWRHTPASCGNATACPAAISSITDTVLSDMKTGFAVSV
jgi:hypothetical protein